MAAAIKRIHEVKCPLPPNANGEGPLFLLHMTAHEELSRPFEYVVDLLSEKDDIDPNKLLGSPMTILVHLADGRIRYFHGLVSNFAYGGPYSGYAHYRAVMRPLAVVSLAERRLSHFSRCDRSRRVRKNCQDNSQVF